MDNRRVYRTIRMGLKQLVPTEAKGYFARTLRTLAAMVGEMVQTRSCWFTAVAHKSTTRSVLLVWRCFAGRKPASSISLDKYRILRCGGSNTQREVIFGLKRVSVHQLDDWILRFLH
jgi:hypothetical protein